MKRRREKIDAEEEGEYSADKPPSCRAKERERGKVKKKRERESRQKEEDGWIESGFKKKNMDMR